MGSSTASAASGRAPRTVFGSRLAPTSSFFVSFSACPTRSAETAPTAFVSGRTMPASPSAQRSAGEPAKGRSRVGVSGSDAPGAAVGAAVSSGSGAASAAPDSPAPKGSPGSSDGFRATSTTAAVTVTPRTAHSLRRRAARPFISCQAGPVRHPGGDSPRASCSRSRSVTIRARADGSLGAEERMSRSLSSRNFSHMSSGMDDEEEPPSSPAPGLGPSDGLSAMILRAFS